MILPRAQEKILFGILILLIVSIPLTRLVLNFVYLDKNTFATNGLETGYMFFMILPFIYNLVVSAIFAYERFISINDQYLKLAYAFTLYFFIQIGFAMIAIELGLYEAFIAIYDYQNRTKFKKYSIYTRLVKMLLGDFWLVLIMFINNSQNQKHDDFNNTALAFTILNIIKFGVADVMFGSITVHLKNNQNNRIF